MAKRDLIPFGLGLLAGLGQAPLGIWGATVIALAVWLAMAPASLKSEFRSGWLFGAGYFAVALHWIVSPFLVDLASTGWMAPFAVILMAGGAAVFWGAAGYLAYRISPDSLALRGAMLAGAEVLRSFIFTGFPWALIGHIWIDTPLAQVAAFGGPHVLSFVTVGLAVALVLVWRRVWWALVMPVMAVAGWILLAAGPVPDYDGPLVRLVQPNAPQSEKWDPAKSPLVFARMIEFTQSAPQPDLVVWPETAITYLMEFADPELTQLADAASGAPVIVGINRRGGERFYNAALVLERGAIVSDVYDKAHIVPFGEFIPGGELLTYLGIDAFAASKGGAFTAGEGARLVDVTGIGLARILICYEGIFANEVHTDDRARMLVLITNDAWFGPAAGPQQHLAQARLRAIEQGLPMVRVANTGVTAMIDAKGRVIEQIGMGQAGFIDVALPPALALTVYARFGDWPALALFLVVFGLIVGRRKVMG